MPSHYTALIEIVKVAPPMGGKVNAGEKKDKTEIARVVVRSDSLDKLVGKTQKHLGLIEEDEA